MSIASNEPMIYNKSDRKAFRWLYYLATVATGHTWTNDERVTLRILNRKYGNKQKNVDNFKENIPLTVN